MAARQRVELVRQCEDHVGIRHVEQLGQAGAAPRIGGPLLAARAMAVAARVPAPLLSTAPLAAQLLAAERSGAAGHDRTPRARLRRA